VTRRDLLLTPAAAAAARPATAAPARAVLPIYAPEVKSAGIYFAHPAMKPVLKYNHDVDIVRFKGRFYASWNANTSPGEHVPGQFNFLSHSDDFEHWSPPVRLFTSEGGSTNPVEQDNQWQPGFINYHDRTLFCAWCTYTGNRTFVSSSSDGAHWTNREVPCAPPGWEGKILGFPTIHGLLTSRGVMMFPCSMPATGKFLVGTTRYAAILMSADGGRTWEWSNLIEAVNWSSLGEDPKQYGGDTITLWEPVIWEEADGRLGLLIRNSTAQEEKETRQEKPHRMILYATSADHGRTWTKARPIEVDSICSRIYAASRASSREDLLMVMNDWHVRIPKPIPQDRFALSLYCAPVCEPDLLLPGPLAQPDGGGHAYYPSGFVDRGTLYLAYTYPSGIHCSRIETLPDYSRPFLLPRGGRPGLKIERGIARFSKTQATLGVTPTAAMLRQPELAISFAFRIDRYFGQSLPVLTLGGKVREGTLLRSVYDAAKGEDVLQARQPGNRWVNLGPLAMKREHRLQARVGRNGYAISLDGAAPLEFPGRLLRKFAIGGLYEAPEWPAGTGRTIGMEVPIASIAIG
jgi:hypothetical protein